MESVKKIEIEYKGEKIILEKLSNGKFKKPNISQFIKSGWGATWLDNCRIPFESQSDVENYDFNRGAQYRSTYEEGVKYTEGKVYSGGWKVNKELKFDLPKGRFPANLLVSDDTLNNGEIMGGKSGKTLHKYDKEYNETLFTSNQNKPKSPSSYGDKGSFSRYFDLDKWFDEVEKTFPFFIVPKASKSEKNNGLEKSLIEERVVSGESTDFGKMGINTPEMRSKRGVTTELPKYKNFHPTVKPLKLMSFLIMLGSKENDLVLDPFCGSGSTCIAAKFLKRNFLGIEIDENFFYIASERLKNF